MIIVLASKNKKKIEELRRILSDSNIRLLSLEDFPNVENVIEDGLTFEENALKKARYVAQKTGLPAIADDSGLEIEALQGAPGVYSARYAGNNATDEDNIRKLISELKGIPLEKRKARFVCCIVLAFPDGKEYVFYGYVKGIITETPRGSEGFGYDPVFQPEGFEKTFAQMSAYEKDKISHRRRALESLRTFLMRYQEKI